MISGTSDKLFSPFARGMLFVGFSGGADSTAALLVVRDWAEKHPECRVEAVHFDHHLRGAESAREAAEAENFASSLGVRFRRIDLRVEDSGDGIEAAARLARLSEWRRLCAGKKNTAAVLGHHADDRAENLLIRLFRGSNTSALTALRGRSDIGGVTFLRPLLGWSRAEVEAFLRGRGVELWQNDSSNTSGAFARNYWRNILLPMIYARFPWGSGGLRRALTALEMDARFIEGAAERFYDSGDPGSGDFWRAADPALRPRLLRRFLFDLTGNDLIPPPAALERLERALLSAGTGEAAEIPIRAGTALYFQDDRLELAAPPPEDAVWLWREVPEFDWGAWRLSCRAGADRSLSGIEAACFDASVLPELLHVGAARPGERMIPFGRRASESLHKLRIDRKVRVRNAPPVLRDDSGTVYWACGVRRGAGAPLTPETSDAVCFYCRRRERDES